MSELPPGDLRAWLSVVESAGLLLNVPGAHWDLELADVSRMNYRRPSPQALLFDRIVGYPAGMRVLTGSMSSARLLGIALRMGADETDETLTERLRGKTTHWAERAREFEPRVVTSGPVLQHTFDGAGFDFFGFPVPLWNEGDGGRFIGTGCMVITSDPDTGTPNGGAYRMQVSPDGRRVTVAIVQGKDGRGNVERWFAKAGRAPVTVSLGHDPMLLLVAGSEVPHGISELAYAGAIAGEPMDVVIGENGLPFPAASEIVLEGWFHPDRLALEGPFAEWTGYYSESAGDAYLMDVTRVHMRDDPVLLGTPPGLPPHDYSYMRSAIKSSMVLDGLQRAGVRGVEQVWAHEAGGGRIMLAVSIDQQFAGHARQVGHLTASLPAAAYMNKFVIVVDGDVDVKDLDHVVWAVCTRSDPGRDIEVIRRTWGSDADPLVRPGEVPHISRAVIDACIPYEDLGTFPRTATRDPGRVAEVRTKWAHLWSE